MHASDTDSPGRPQPPRRSAVLRLVTALILLLSSTALPAGTTGAVMGYVNGPSQDALAGARVTATSPALPGSRIVVTDGQGFYRFADLPPGEYALRVEKDGLRTAVQTGIRIYAGQTIKVPTFRLKPVADTRAIEIVEERPLIEQGSTSIGRTLSGDFLKSVPTGGSVPYSTGPRAGSKRARSATSFNTEAYNHVQENGFQRVADRPRSTFAIDVDTASYSNVRRFLREGTLPPVDAVRIEELINYFPYRYPRPGPEEPFSLSAEVASCPWNPTHRLVHIGLQAKRIETPSLPARNLVFLVDVSGSMASPDKLPLVKRSLEMLSGQLNENDIISIVVYAGAAGLVLPPTHGDRRPDILEALSRLQAGGSTAGGAGIELAYAIAREHFITGGVNRVILATDGDFNVGVSSPAALVRLIEEKRETGIFLTVLGFGTGNLKDGMMEQLADHGNGQYAYIDGLEEARKALIADAGAGLVTVAKDVKIQVEFNPLEVAGYRLVGYENRALRDEDFNDDAKDAGELGAGHSVTVLYEVVPAGAAVPAGTVDPLRYQRPAELAPVAATGELMTVKIRYKHPDARRSRLSSFPIHDRGTAIGEASTELRFASAVAMFGLLLRRSEHRGQASWEQVLELGGSALEADPGGYRYQFLELATVAESLQGWALAGERGKIEGD